MHVLITSDAVGGVWTYTRELVSGLTRRGHRVSLVSFGQRPSDEQLRWMRELRGLEYHATDFPLEWMQDSAAGIAASMEYLQLLIERIKPDLLHSSQYCYGALKCSIPKLVVAHSDVLSWWHEVHGSSPPDTPWLSWYRHIASVGLRNADVVVAPSEWMLDAVRQYYASPARGSVIYNGRDPALFSRSSHKQNCVLSVGRVWDQAKQIRLLLARSQSVPVKIAGSDQHPEKASSAIMAAGSDENVTLLGSLSVDELLALYARSSIYAATSRYEPFGLAPLEAALSGCALLVNDIPTFRELWGDSALYFRRNDADALADSIRNLGANARMREEYGHRAALHARERFDSQRMVLEYEELYREVACLGVAA
jgi:glycosyltransferase involved in cell wall biosynthesis